MTFLTTTQLSSRIEAIQDGVVTYALDVANDYIYGRECASRKIVTLQLSLVYLEIVQNYVAIDPPTVEEEDNSITETQLLNILEHLAILLKITYN